MKLFLWSQYYPGIESRQMQEGPKKKLQINISHKFKQKTFHKILANEIQQRTKNTMLQTNQGNKEKSKVRSERKTGVTLTLRSKKFQKGFIVLCH